MAKTQPDKLEEKLGEKKKAKSNKKSQRFEVEVVADDETKEDSSEATPQTETIVKEAEPDLDLEVEETDAKIGGQKKTVRILFGIGTLLFVFILAITGFVFYLKTTWLPNEIITEVAVSDDSTIEVDVIEPPTPSVLEREEIKLEILNGSGVSGAAGKYKIIFEDLGYEDVEVGNGEDTVGNELYVRAADEEKVTTLLEDVLDELDISSVTGYLDEDSPLGARIVLGK